jgi:hypothetical protein
VADETDPEAYTRGLLRTLALARGSRLPAAAAEKLPADTVRAARVPAGVHLALTGTARRIDLRIRVGADTWRPAPTLPEVFLVHSPAGSYPVPLDRGSDLVRIDLPNRLADQRSPARTWKRRHVARPPPSAAGNAVSARRCRA